jgi:two-component system, chemotaxis family, sensor kinase CheA
MTAQGETKGYAVEGMDEARLRRAYLEEAEEMAGTLNHRLVELEANPTDEGLVNEAFRLFHSLKSESALVGFTRLAEVAHRTEDLFELVRRRAVALDRPVMDSVFAATDLINEMIARIGSSGTDAGVSTDEVLEALRRAAGPAGPAGPAKGAAAQVPNGRRGVIRAEQIAAFSRADRELIEESRRRRERLYRLTCELDETCPMKFARAYLVTTALELVASVLKAIPPLEMPAEGEEVQDEGYGRLVLYLAASEGPAVLGRAADVDEVRKIDIVELDYDEVLGPSEPFVAREEGSSPAPQPKRQGPERTSIRVETRKLDEIWRLVGQLVITKGRLGRLLARSPAAETAPEVGEQLESVGDAIGAVAEGLQQAMMETRMVPISVLFDKLPRLVRDLSRQTGKEADLKLLGETTEIDRSLVEALSDPLTHLIRNCLDHGLEPREARVRAGKSERGTISVSAFQEGGKVVVEVSDDGRGLDLARIRAKAVERGLLPADSELPEPEIVKLIYLPGFSTAESVTEISGRGVGMDVVATRVRDVLRGEVLVRTESGAGTRFTLVLPLTLTILNTLVVRVGRARYAVPALNVDETAKLRHRDILAEAGGRRASHRGEEIGVHFLSELLGSAIEPREVYDTVIVTHRGRRAYLVVDELVEALDVVVKPVDEVANPGRLYSGVAVLGDGSILLILSAGFIGD